MTPTTQFFVNFEICHQVILFLCISVSSSPTNLVLDEVESRKFMIKFGHPANVSGILAGYKILILQGQDCIQQILVFETPICDLCVVNDFNMKCL